MRKPKTIRCYQHVIRAEDVYSFKQGPVEVMEFVARKAVHEMMRCYGPNAKGEFHVQIIFYPDGYDERP